MTYTYVTVGVTRETFEAVRTALRLAGDKRPVREPLDMHGLALIVDEFVPDRAASESEFMQEAAKEAAIVQDIMARLRLSKALDSVDDLALQYIVQQTRNFSRGS